LKMFHTKVKRVSACSTPLGRAYFCAREGIFRPLRVSNSNYFTFFEQAIQLMVLELQRQSLSVAVTASATVSNLFNRVSFSIISKLNNLAESQKIGVRSTM